MMRRRLLIIAPLSAVASSTRAAASAVEDVRIDRLIRFAASRHELKFVRNGEELRGTDAPK